MADLYIDGDALRRTKSNVSRIEELLRDPCTAMKDLPVEAAGHERLTSRLHDFADEWGYGIGQLGKFSGGCVDVLQSIEETFNGLEDELARCFEQGSAS